ncbi:MAG: Uroporphyrinogen-III C-methyltransferase [Planctomycetota bacterium]
MAEGFRSADGEGAGRGAPQNSASGQVPETAAVPTSVPTSYPTSLPGSEPASEPVDMRHGKVYLVGAGPGDPGLLTLRGAQCLRLADAILYDYLVNPALLTHARPDARRECLGRHGHTRLWSQAEINAELVRLAAAGLQVVRLKGGDPAVFGRAAEECEALASAGIAYEIVPGVTAALAAGSFAGIPLTHRGLASAAALITGQEDADKEGSSLDFHALARFPGTLVFYMGVTTVEQWSQALIDAGKPSDTPAAIVRRVSWPDQTMVQTTLGELAQHLVPASRMRPPVIVVVGPVVRLANRFAWRPERPLAGRTVLLARPTEQMAEAAGPLEELGAEVLCQPAIAIGPPNDWSPVDRVIDTLGDPARPAFDWVVFASGNGVRHFLNRLPDRGRDHRVLGRSRIAAIGPGTARELARYHLRADLVPDAYHADALAAALAPQAAGKRFLLIRANRGRDVLPQALTAAGGIVEQVAAYSSRDVESVAPEIRQRLDDGDVDWALATSSAIARSLVSLLGNSLRHCRIASISPITSATLRELGFEPDCEARKHDMAGLIETLRNHASNKSKAKTRAADADAAAGADADADAGAAAGAGAGADANTVTDADAVPGAKTDADTDAC